MRKILYIFIAILFVSLFNKCVSESDLIDGYVADTTLSIWSQKFNNAIYNAGNQDTIVLGVDNFQAWSIKVNWFIDSMGYDSIIYGTDDFEDWRTKFNNANWDFIINPIADSIGNRWVPVADSSELIILATLTDTLDYYGIWDKADIYRIYAANSEASAVINTKNTSFTATPQNSITFTEHEGYSGNGSTMYIQENFNPAVDADSFQLNNATIHLYNNDNNLTPNDMLFGMKDISDNWLECFFGATEYRFRLNNLSSGFVFNEPHENNIMGGITITRDRDDSLNFVKNDGVRVWQQSNSSALPNHVNGQYTLAWNNNGATQVHSGNTASFMYMGAALTQLQAQKLYQAEKRYLEAFGTSADTIVFNEVTIDPDGGGDYTSITDALAAITNNTSRNQYNLNISDTLYEVGIEMKDWIHLIGDDTSTAKIIGYLPADTTEAAIIQTSTIDCDYVNCNFENIHISIQNGRYAIHSDAGSAIYRSEGATQNFTGCKIVHEGNAEADAFWGHEVWATTDALGAGLSFNMTINVNNCEAVSKGTSTTTSRGIAQHAATASTYKSIMNISNTICRTNTTYALRIGMLFNNQDEYYFNDVEMYGGGLLIDGAGTYTDNTTEVGTEPIILNGNLIAD